MRLIKALIIFIFIANLLTAQKVKVVETTKVPIDIVEQTFYPQFNKDDTKIIFSSAGYKGLFVYQLETKESSIITEANGAGYNPLILNSETILYRTFDLVEGKKYHSLRLYDLKTGIENTIQKDKRLLKLPKQNINNELLIVENSVVKKENISEQLLLKNSEPNRAIYVEDNNLILVYGNETKILNPLGEGVYVWESFSSDGKKILFSFGNQGTFVCDLEGNILLNIKDARYPKFSPNGKYISYMNDKDNGYNYISSDILVYSIDLNESFEVTNTEDKIEMFAEWSNDGNRLVYNTTEGEIFITKLQFEN